MYLYMTKDRISCPEAVAHFGCLACLDRVANGGGRVDHEYAVGRGRLAGPLIHGALKRPFEVEMHQDRDGDPVPEGLLQIDRSCEGVRVARARFVVFDQRRGADGIRSSTEKVVMPGVRSLLVVRAWLRDALNGGNISRKNMGAIISDPCSFPAGLLTRRSRSVVSDRDQANRTCGDFYGNLG